MTYLPIVQRELLVSSRKKLTFWSRVVAAFIGFLAVLFILEFESVPVLVGALGAKLFRWLTVAAFWPCLFSGALLTADCLSVERREGTLGLLFLTDLKGYDVVLGKLAAKSITGVFCLIAILPMLAVPILLGGVTGRDFWCVVLLLLNTLFVSLCAGMLVSVFCQNARVAVMAAAFAIVLWIVVPRLVAFMLPRPFNLAILLSPMTPYAHALGGRFARMDYFLSSIILQHALGWICLAVASRRSQTSWHEQRKERPISTAWHEFSRGNAAKRLALRRLLLPINPIFWIESRDLLLRTGVLWLFAFLALVSWLINCDRYFHWVDTSAAMATVIFLHLLLKFLVAFNASGRMVEAKREDALTVVLSTRVNAEDVLRGEFLAIRRLFAWPLGIVLAFDFLWLLASVRFGGRTSNILAGPLVIGCLVALLLINCQALVWTGLSYSLRSKRPYRAGLRAFAVIVLAPLAWFSFLAPAFKKDFVLGVMIFTLCSALNSLMFGHMACQRFKSDFREVLTEHPRPPENTLEEDYALLQ